MDLKSQYAFYKRSTVKASLALQWIDELTVNTSWWIHMDDEILHSSQAETEVLQSALHLRKEITEGKTIILSNDLTLKIKAMAEVCTAFHPPITAFSCIILYFLTIFILVYTFYRALCVKKLKNFVGA